VLDEEFDTLMHLVSRPGVKVGECWIWDSCVAGWIWGQLRDDADATSQWITLNE
jgi:hypothetical protein